MKWNKNIRCKSHIFQLQIPENLCVSLVRYVDNITNPVIQTHSLFCFPLIMKGPNNTILLSSFHGICAELPTESPTYDYTQKESQ